MRPAPTYLVYWLCQGLGWGLFGVLTLVFFSLNQAQISWAQYALTFIFCAGGLVLSHLFRRLVRALGWVRLGVVQLIVQVLVANAAMALALDAIILAGPLAMGYTIQSRADWLELAGAYLNTTLVFGIWSLLYFVAYAFRNYRQEEIERLRGEQRLKDSELARLKSQMNPHFVFNALNSIRALVAEDPAKAQRSITQLSNLLRQFIVADRLKTVSLEEELRTVSNYLNLEKLRYEERLTFTQAVDPAALPIHMPTMSLQALVENAVKHGIGNQVDGGWIHLHAYLTEDRLHIEVTNSGTLTQGGPGTGSGLLNTRMRMQLLYNADATFELSQLEGAVLAKVVLPLRPRRTTGG